MDNKLTLLLFLFIPLFLEFCKCNGCFQEHRDALLEFKKSLEPYREKSALKIHELSSWNRSNDCCQWWVGVTCSRNFSGVTSVVLEANLLGSGLSSHVLYPLFRIKTLTTLTMSNYPFSGEIPGKHFLNLTRLKILRLEKNNFSGSIPLELGSLTQLTDLSLSRNNLKGEIPLGLFELENLKDLDLGENNLFLRNDAELTSGRRSLSRLSLKLCNISGKFPALLSQYTTLKELDLSGNYLNESFPEWLPRLQLQTLNLSSNKLTGSLPHRLFQSQKLQTLDLYGNKISGELPISIGEANSLKHLDLSQNCFNGSVPESITRLHQLQTLNLSNNTLSGSLPVFRSYPSYVDLSRNSFTGRIPRTLLDSVSTLILSENKLSGNLPWNVSGSRRWNISHLDLKENGITGEIPTAISQWSQLRFLNLRGNYLTGKIPRQLSNLTLLQVLDLSNNGFTGEVPLTLLQNIPIINLGQNALSGTLPSDVVNSSKWQIIHLDLQDNNITGEIPTVLSVLFQLRLLNLRNNSLTGRIPCSISNQTQILILSHNHFTGLISPCLGNLSGMIKNPELFRRTIQGDPNYFLEADMKVIWKETEQKLLAHQVGMYTLLDLSCNQLAGEVPDTLGDLTSLKTLNLSSNQLSGQIPDSLGNLKELESLDLSHNGFNGRIPQSFTELKSLTDLDLSNNKLSGKIPTGPQMDRMNDPINYANNSGLCGEQIQQPCEEEKKPEGQNSETEDETIPWLSLPAIGSGFLLGFIISTALAYHFVDITRFKQCFTVEEKPDLIIVV